MKPVGKMGWRKASTQRTRAVYFRTLAELDLIKRAARKAGVPWSAFMREACLRRAQEIMEVA